MLSHVGAMPMISCATEGLMRSSARAKKAINKISTTNPQKSDALGIGELIRVICQSSKRCYDAQTILTTKDRVCNQQRHPLNGHNEFSCYGLYRFGGRSSGMLLFERSLPMGPFRGKCQEGSFKYGRSQGRQVQSLRSDYRACLLRTGDAGKGESGRHQAF